MPLINGLKALEYLRGLAETKTIPILFLSGGKPPHGWRRRWRQRQGRHVKKPIDWRIELTPFEKCLQKYPT